MNTVCDARYWTEQIAKNFPDRDPIEKNSHFVISYLMTPPPSNIIAHGIMNFSSFEKMMGFVKYVILAPAVCDALGIDYVDRTVEELATEIENAGSDLEFVKDLDPHGKAALLMWHEADAILKTPDEVRVLWTDFFREHFEYLFSCAGECVYGLEIVYDTDTLLSFWENFFMLDTDEEFDVEELAGLKEALETGNTELLDDLISYH